MKFSNYFLSPVVRLLSLIGGILVGGAVAVYGLISKQFTGWIWGLLVGAGMAVLLSVFIPLRLWIAEAPYRRAKENLPQPLLWEQPVRFTVPGGVVNGYLILTKQSLILLSFERGEQRMDLPREEVQSIILEEDGIRIFLNDTKFISFSAIHAEQIYELLRREGWNG